MASIEARIAAYERAIEIDPEWPEGWAHLPRALIRVGDEALPLATPETMEASLERARAALDRALALRPDDPLLLSDRGYCAFALGDWNDAARFYRRCAERFPQRREGLEAAGLLALAEGRFADAERAFSRAMEIDPQQLDYLERAAARYARGAGAAPLATGPSIG